MVSDAIIFSGGGRKVDGSLTDMGIQRLNKVLELYKDRKARKIISSGGYWGTYGPTSVKYEESGADLRKKWFINKGVNPDDIILCPEGGDTISEGIANYKIAKKNHFSKLILVTSDIHMPRCLFIFKSIFGNNFKIFPAKVPGGSFLIADEEKEYLSVTKKLFFGLPKDFLNVDLNTWHKNHKEFYLKLKAIHDKYHPPGRESQAYLGVSRASDHRSLVAEIVL